jgi:hypothetical protein
MSFYKKGGGELVSNLYSLDYRIYESGSKRFIEVFKNNPSITSHDLDQLSAKMIQANSIPLLIPLEMEEINVDVTLHYNITGLQTLSSYIRNMRITAKEFFELLNRILLKMEESKEFMLNESKFVIHSDFIYVRNNLEDIRLMYLPLNEVASMQPFQVEFRDLMINIIGNVSNLSGNGFQEILNYLKSRDFKIDNLRSLLEGHIHSVNSNQHAPVREIPVKQEMKVPDSQPIKPNPVVPKQPKSPFVNKNDAVSKNEKNVTSAETVDNSVLSQEDKKPSERVKVITILAAVLAIGLIWKIYLDNPSEGLLYVCSGLSLLTINLAFITLFVIKPGSTKQERKEAPKNKKKEKAPKQKKRKGTKNNDALPREIDSHVPKAEPITVTNDRQYDNPNEYYQNLQNQTTLLSKPNVAKTEVAATVLLSDVENKKVQRPYVEVEKNGVIQKVNLEKDRFVFGRNPDSSDFTIQATGVSRTHFEIIFHGGEYSIRDLNSSNGTKLNDQRLIPQRIYPLKDQDLIIVAKQLLKFRKEFK